MAKIDIYNANLCNEQFLFYEMRIVAKLMIEGLSEDEIIVGRFVIRSWLATSDREIDRSKTTGIKYNPFLFIVLAY